MAYKNSKNKPRQPGGYPENRDVLPLDDPAKKYLKQRYKSSLN